MAKTDFILKRIWQIVDTWHCLEIITVNLPRNVIQCLIHEWIEWTYTKVVFRLGKREGQWIIATEEKKMYFISAYVFAVKKASHISKVSSFWSLKLRRNCNSRNTKKKKKQNKTLYTLLELLCPSLYIYFHFVLSLLRLLLRNNMGSLWWLISHLNIPMAVN